jgi:polyhydroxybutyrate depolymerase
MKALIQAWTLGSAAVMLNVASLAAEPARLTIDGKERTYLIEKPPGQAPRPTIIMLHGLNGSGADVARATGLDRLAPQSGWVAVFPDRQPPLQGWNFFPSGREPSLLLERSRAIGGVPNDAGFLKALVADLVRRGVSDPKRIYLAGVSNGSFMALRMICADAEIFAAVGLLVGGMPEVLGDECRPAKPVPVMMLNGTADTTVPYAGGAVQPGGLFSAWPTERLAAFFRKLNGCSERHDDSLLPNARPNKVEVTHWTSCAGGPVLSYRVIGADHAAPWNNNVDVGRLLTSFFNSKSRSDVRAQTSVKAVFEQHNLLGTFAWDCGKPANANNLYYVHRLLDADRVRRDQMSSPTTRDWVVLLDQAAEVRPNEITISGTLTGRIGGRDLDGKPVSGVLHVEPNRLRQWEGIVNGEKLLDGGRLVSNGFQVPWSNRCGGSQR